MKTSISLILILIICSFKILGQTPQDILVLTNSDTIRCKIVSVYGNHILYQEAGKADYERNAVKINQIDKVFLSPESELGVKDLEGFEGKVYSMGDTASDLEMNPGNALTNEKKLGLPIEAQLRFHNGDVLDYQGNALNYAQIQFYLKDNQQASSQMQAARQNQIAALTFYSLAVITAVPVLVIGKTSLATGNYDNIEGFSVLFGASVVSTVAALIAESAYKEKTQLAIKLFNDGGRTLSDNSVLLKMGLVQGGLGISIQL